MLLPLLKKAKEQSAYFLLTRKTGSRSSGAPQCGTPFATAVARIPQPPLLPGEPYRFHFDMTKCVGGKCCVVACNEQNGNPAEINWRRVERSKAAGTRIPTAPVFPWAAITVWSRHVLHSAETCIGARRRVALGAIQQRTAQYSGGVLLFAGAFLAASLILLELGTQWDLRWHQASVARAGIFSYQKLFRAPAPEAAE
jgi:hypothetical protein